ncbi:hypothetical protein A7U60_g1517 [Sanghuangporus baumii]|uniref:Uncharacterized protein n=1 Tax=Sanghuangporus baumii TaxID=108892 RepID=A0A9Q5N938_SANBA|nr:hypothetical protein A7U60_g1517 [Sanghuangporus baumii]
MAKRPDSSSLHPAEDISKLLHLKVYCVALLRYQSTSLSQQQQQQACITQGRGDGIMTVEFAVAIQHLNFLPTPVPGSSDS